jgi:hypothetical protein
MALKTLALSVLLSVATAQSFSDCNQLETGIIVLDFCREKILICD